MHITPINNNINNRGLYFTKIKPVIAGSEGLSKELADKSFAVSKTGIRYIEDTGISESIKERFANDTFIKSLSENFDTFIHYTEETFGKYKKEYVSRASISWGTEDKLKTKDVGAFSECSHRFAQESMFNRLKKKIFLHPEAV